MNAVCKIRHSTWTHHHPHASSVPVYMHTVVSNRIFITNQRAVKWKSIQTHNHRIDVVICWNMQNSAGLVSVKSEQSWLICIDSYQRTVTVGAVCAVCAELQYQINKRSCHMAIFNICHWVQLGHVWWWIIPISIYPHTHWLILLLVLHVHYRKLNRNRCLYWPRMLEHENDHEGMCRVWFCVRVWARERKLPRLWHQLVQLIDNLMTFIF